MTGQDSRPTGGAVAVSAKVFICHASADGAVALRIAVGLEAGGIPCWISSRDVGPGANFQEAIVAALRQAPAVVFLLSQAANLSDEVRKELALASTFRRPVLPVRLAGVEPVEALRYELATRQWIDVGDNALDAVGALRAALSGHAASAPALSDEPAHASVGLLELPDRPSIAVLPFLNLGGSADHDWFADGIAQDIIVELSRFPALFVIARNSSFSYRDQKVDSRQIARDLGVRYLVEGSIRAAGARLRITSQLSDCLTGSQLWAERYDRDLDDILDIQEDVTRHIVAAVAPQVELATVAQARTRPPSSEVQHLCWRALGQMEEGVRRGLPAMVLEAIQTAERALAANADVLAPHFVLAWAHWSCHLYQWGPSPAEALDRVAAAVDQMARIAPLDHRTLTTSGILRTIRGEHARALADLRRSLEVNPNASQTLMWLAFCEAAAGEWDAARGHAALSMRLNPRDHWIGVAQLAMAMSDFGEGHDAEAALWAERSIQSEPAAPLRRAMLVACLAASGDSMRATQQRAELEALAPGFIGRLSAGGIPLFQLAAVHERLVRALSAAA